MTKNNIIFILIAAALQLGCQTIRYDLRPPNSDAGRACITQCAGIREACRGNEISRANSERFACERESDRTLHACLARADSKERREDCNKKKPGCWVHEDTERCEAEYRSCFGLCGGTVTKVVE